MFVINELNVVDFGATANGTDDTSAIQCAIDSAPSGSQNAQPATVIRFPTPANPSEGVPQGQEGPDQNTARYVISAPLLIPPDKNLVFAGTASHGVLLDYTGSDPWMFIAETSFGGRSLRFRRLFLHGGGVSLTGPYTGGVSFEDCQFHCTPQWAVHATGPVGPVDFSRCDISECGTQGAEKADEGFGAGIFMGPHCRDWTLSHCQLHHNWGTELRVEGAGVRVMDCNFELRIAGAQSVALSRPFVQVSPGASNVRLTRTRFGNEPPTPKAYVRLGAEVAFDGVDPPEPVNDVRLDGCVFRAQPAEKHSSVGLQLTAPVNGLRLTGCAFGGLTQVLDEVAVLEAPIITAMMGSDAYTTAAQGQSGLDAPAVQWVQRPVSYFTAGGRGVELTAAPELAPALDRWQPPLRLTWNLLEGTHPGVTQSELDAAWEQTALVAVPLPDNAPDGGDAWFLFVPPPSASGDLSQTVSSHVLRDAADLAGVLWGEPYRVVFSAWLRASASTRATLGIRPSLPGVGYGAQAEVQLGDVWRRYHVSAQLGDGYQALSATVFVEVVGAGGSVVMAWPQLELGPEPTALEVGPAVGLAQPRPAQAQAFGLNTWRLTPPGESTPPFSGVWLQGDRVANPTPKESGPLAWVCRKSGTGASAKWSVVTA